MHLHVTTIALTFSDSLTQAGADRYVADHLLVIALVIGVAFLLRRSTILSISGASQFVSVPPGMSHDVPQSHEPSTAGFLIRSLDGLLCAAVVAACSEGAGPQPVPPATVSGVSPNNGPQGGGTAVTITGANFPTTIDSVRVGTGRLSAVVRVSGTQLTGTTPASGTAGAAGVTVYTTAAGNGTCAGCFTYNPPVTVSGVSPNNGPQGGGTAVTITGANFPTTIDSVRVGTGRLSALVPVSGSLLRGTIPASATAGAVDVTVYTSAAGNATCTGCFTYHVATVTWTSVATGSNHTCGLTSGGSAYCWGYNIDGQLGDGSTTDRWTPVAVSGGLSFQSLTAGFGYTCGLTSGGAAYCWGRNAEGELGDGSTTDRLSPVAVSGGLSFQTLDGGGYHTCGLTSSGAPYCWGWNIAGQLGDGSTTDQLTPVAVSGGLSFQSLIAGGFHTCGVTTGGAAYCFGFNGYGQLGDGSTTDRLTPVAVSGGLSFQTLTAGRQHSCGVTNGGASYCWGLNDSGQLGNGTTVDQLTPVPVSGGLSLQTVTAGERHTCGATSAGTASCWGRNDVGQLGDGSTIIRGLTPVAVSGGLSFQSLSAGAGSNHTCGVTSGGVAYCWGGNSFGALGDGSQTEQNTPVAVVSP